MTGFAEGRILALMVELFLKSSVVLAAAMAGAGLLCRRSASLRHFWLSICLVGLAFLPALSVLSPGWHAAWLPDWAAAPAVPGLGRGAGAVGRPGGMTDVRAGTGMAAVALDLSAGGRAASAAAAEALNFRAFLAEFLSAIWLSGLVLILARLAAGLLSVRRLTSEGEALDDPSWKRLLQRFMSAVRLNRNVEIKGHPQVLVPLTWGFRHPVVIMPGGTGGWTEDARSSALFHELSHVKRGDFLVMLLVRLSLAVFWLNPLFWIAYKKLKDEQEKACDELVLKAGIRPSVYADTLLSFLRSVRMRRSRVAAFPGVLGMFGRSRLRERLTVILGQKMAFKEVRMKTKFAVAVMVFLAVAFIGLARTQGASANPEPGPMAAAAAVAAAPADQTRQTQETQKSAEQQKKEETQPAEPAEKEKKVRKEVKIVVEGKEPGTVPVEITVMDGKTQKTIKLDGSALIVKKGEDGKTVLVSPEGKEIAVIGGEGTRLEIKGGRTIFLEDEKAFHEHKEPMVFTVIEGDKKVSTVFEEGQEVGKKTSTVMITPKPHLEIVQEVEEPEHITIKRVDKGDGEIIIKKRHTTPEPHVSVLVDEKELEARLAETQALLKKMTEQKLAESNLKAQQEALKELEKSLQALEEELKKKEESLKVYKFFPSPEAHVTREGEEVPEVWEWVEKSTPGEERHADTIVISRDQDADSIVMTMKLKDNPKATYEKAVAKLKQGLPQGYALDPKFVEESGTMIIKITGPKGTEADRYKVQKLVEELQAELKK